MRFVSQYICLSSRKTGIGDDSAPGNRENSYTVYSPSVEKREEVEENEFKSRRDRWVKESRIDNYFKSDKTFSMRGFNRGISSLTTSHIRLKFTPKYM